MAFVSAIDVIGSGFTAQQQRLDIISENIVNMNTTRLENGVGPYRSMFLFFQANDSGARFQDVLNRTRRTNRSRWAAEDIQGGVRVVEIAEDPSDFKLKYDPDDPDANEDGYVEMPNVDLVKEITDGMAASQAFSANVSAFNLLKSLLSKGMEIGK